MKQGLLILEDGRILSGKTSLTHNAFGKVSLKGSNATLQDPLNEYSFEVDTHTYAVNSLLVGKIVVDTLPIEYHMYDVKNTVINI